MGSKELGLRLAAIASLAIPPARTIGVQNGTAGSLNRDVVALNLEERAGPFFVAPSRGALEDDLQVSIQVSIFSWKVHLLNVRLTVVPSFRSLRSSVTPEGTATFESTMVAHDFCDLLAEDAPFEPEKVQVVARSSSLGA